MDVTVISTLFLGFALGLAHALDPDHLVAVGTLTAESKSTRRSSLLGILWGAGHTLALAGVGLVVLSLKLAIPDYLATRMEMVVGIMIILLGGSLVRRSLQEYALHSHTHSHNGSMHTHFHIHRKGQGQKSDGHHHHDFRSWRKAFAVGLIHGLAGSAALTLAIMTTMPSTLLGFVYILVFGVGSTGGMVIMSAVISLPFLLSTHWAQSSYVMLKTSAGLVAVGFGGCLTYSLLP